MVHQFPAEKCLAPFGTSSGRDHGQRNQFWSSALAPREEKSQVNLHKTSSPDQKKALHLTDRSGEAKIDTLEKKGWPLQQLMTHSYQNTSQLKETRR
jgi:hypothetical protein